MTQSAAAAVAPEAGASLVDLEVLILDCQATRAASAGGVPIELGFCLFRASDDEAPAITSRILQPPPEVVLPPRVATLTGLREDELSAGVPPEVAWRELLAALPAPRWIAVAHFARYEDPFLRAIHGKAAPDLPFPLQLICTHEMARRLFPELPRRTLRAVSGYIGHSVPEARRAAPHVAATAAVWRALVRRLSERLRIHTLPELEAWLAAPPPVPGKRLFPMAPGRRLRVPASPGIYRFLGADGRVLYVGKARSLRRRVNGYFQKQRHASGRTLELLSQVKEIDVTPARTALEAAILEVEAIRAEVPPYNVLLRPGRLPPVSVPREITPVPAALRLRRLRWLARVSDGVLCFLPRVPREGRRVLQVKGGAVSAVHDLPFGEEAPVPASLSRPTLEREMRLDQAARARLRVLLSELRRLVSEGREVTVALGPGRILDRPLLARLRPWA